jgi:hypothetical protein
MFEEEKRRKKECGTKIPFINVFFNQTWGAIWSDLRDS